ncbi:MAG: TonB-dependent receptor [Candidatus Marinimicrobia bacterium]|nr:TonB-dependent receptor [Candidatus Neomarinimicrobiota bacterium]
MLKLKELCMIIIVPVSSIIAQNTGVITGTVKDMNAHNPLQEAVVIISETKIGDISDSNGEFRIENIAPGNYILKTNFVGYETDELMITVSDGKTTNVKVELRIKPINVEELVVTAQRNDLSPQIKVYGTSENSNDIGEFFRQINGGSAVKKGGFAMDPVLRAFKYDQLNVQYDSGIRCWGGCPNRMDPATSHVQSEDVERIEIIKGPFNVRFGQTMGGLVNLVLKKPKQGKIGGSIVAGYESNSGGRKTRISIFGGKNSYDFYLAGGVKKYDNYFTGANIEIPSSFNVSDYTLKVGHRLTDNQRLQFSYRQSFASDIDYPGLSMDAENEDTDIIALDYSARTITKNIFLLTAKLFKTNVHHVMHNENRPNYTVVHSVTDALTMTYGGRFEAGLNMFGNNLIYVGMDYYRLNKDGNREKTIFENICTGTVFENPISVIDLIWQESTLSDFGMFSELNIPIGETINSKIGFRADMISSEINDPSEQYMDAYGDIFRFSSTNYSSMASINYKPRYSTAITLSMAQGMRTPNITERYINHLPIGLDPYEYFGNPNLKPEVNNQIEFSLTQAGKKTRINTSIYFSHLTNYITAVVDTSLDKLYLPCVNPTEVKRFVNIENAMQYGFEAVVQGYLGKQISYVGNVSYIIAENIDVDDPLPEIPPLESNIAVRYLSDNNLTAEMSGRFVSEQDKISELNGETVTPGFSVYNFNIEYTIKRWEIKAGVLNLFNTDYYEHLSRKYKNMQDSFLLHEQGRNLTLNVTYKF